MSRWPENLAKSRPENTLRDHSNAPLRNSSNTKDRVNNSSISPGNGRRQYQTIKKYSTLSRSRSRENPRPTNQNSSIHNTGTSMSNITRYTGSQHDSLNGKNENTEKNFDNTLTSRGRNKLYSSNEKGGSFVNSTGHESNKFTGYGSKRSSGRFKSPGEGSPPEKDQRTPRMRLRKKLRPYYSRFDNFIHNLEMKKYYAASELENNEVEIYEEETMDRDQTRGIRNASVEEIIKMHTTKSNLGKERTLSIEKETINPLRDYRVNSIGNIVENKGASKRRTNSAGSGFEENADVAYRTSSDELTSPTISFTRDEALVKRNKMRVDTLENPFQTSTLTNSEIEIELLRLKKDNIFLEEKLKERDENIEELKNLLEEAQNEVLKIHKLRDKDFDKIKQFEAEVFQLRRINKNIETELYQTLRIQHPKQQTPQEEEEANQSPEENPLMESYQIVRILKQDRALLRKRVQECEAEIEAQKQRNENLRNELNQFLVEKDDKALQKGLTRYDIENVLSGYIIEIEGLRASNQKANRKIEEFLNEIEQREIQFEKDLEAERKKTLEVFKEVEKITRDKGELEGKIEEMLKDKKMRSEIFKAQTEKINDVINELAKENTNFKRQIKILSKDRTIKEKLEYLEAYYKLQSQALLKEKEALRRKLKEPKLNKENSGLNQTDGTVAPVSEDELIQEKNQRSRNNSNSGEVRLRNESEENIREENKRRSKEEMRWKRQFEEYQNQIMTLNQKKEGYVEEINKLKEKVKTLEGEKKTMRGNLENLKNKTLETVNEYEEKLRARDQQIELLNKEYTLLRSRGSDPLINELKVQNDKLLEEIKLLQNQLKIKTSDLEEKSKLLEERSRQLVEQANIPIEMSKVAAEQAKKTAEQLAEMTEQVNAAVKGHQKLEEDIKSYKVIIEEKENLIIQLSEKLKNAEENKAKMAEGSEISAQDTARENDGDELSEQKEIVRKQKDMIMRIKKENEHLKSLLTDQDEHYQQFEKEKGLLHNKIIEQEEVIAGLEKNMESLLMQMAETTQKEQDYLKQIKALKAKASA